MVIFQDHLIMFLNITVICGKAVKHDTKWSLIKSKRLWCVLGVKLTEPFSVASLVMLYSDNAYNVPQPSWICIICTYIIHFTNGNVYISFS